MDNLKITVKVVNWTITVYFLVKLYLIDRLIGGEDGNEITTLNAIMKNEVKLLNVYYFNTNQTNNVQYVNIKREAIFKRKISCFLTQLKTGSLLLALVSSRLVE